MRRPLSRFVSGIVSIVVYVSPPVIGKPSRLEEKKKRHIRWCWLPTYHLVPCAKRRARENCQLPTVERAVALLGFLDHVGRTRGPRAPQRSSFSSSAGECHGQRKHTQNHA